MNINIDQIINEDLTKYSDLTIITQKIKQKGYYSELMQLFLKIFKEESEFTLQELDKIARDRDEDIDFLEQFWVNSDIFRTNFLLIIKSMGKDSGSILAALNEIIVVDTIWKNEDLVAALFENLQMEDESEEEAQGFNLGQGGARKKKKKAKKNRRKSRNGITTGPRAQEILNEPTNEVERAEAPHPEQNLMQHNLGEEVQDSNENLEAVLNQNGQLRNGGGLEGDGDQEELEAGYAGQGGRPELQGDSYEEAVGI